MHRWLDGVLPPRRLRQTDLLPLLARHWLRQLLQLLLLLREEQRGAQQQFFLRNG
jgi:hypothetical protein